MGNDSLIASTTQFQTLLIALVLIVAVIYFFIELRRVDSRISSLETSIKNLINDNEIQMNNIRSQKSNIDFVPNVESNVERNDIEQDLEPNVEQDLEKGINDYVENQLNNEVNDEIQELNQHVNEEVEEVLSNGKKEELEINTESIAVSGLSILSYMPMASNINEPSNNIEEINEDTNVEESVIEEFNVEVSVIDDSNAEDTNIDDSNVEESVIDDSNAEVSNPEESVIDDSNAEVSNPEESNIQELDISEPIEENSDTNQSSIKDMTIKELKNVLNDMELPTSGNKTKLIQRIISNQK